MNTGDGTPDDRSRRTVLAVLAGATTTLAGCATGNSTTTTSPEDASSTDADGATTAPSTNSAAEPTTNASLDVPESARIDDPVGVVATGLPPDAQVRVDATTRPPWEGANDWTASATVRTDADGRVDLRDATPVDGAYEASDGTGLFWSMRPDVTPEEAYFPLATHDVSLAVRPTTASGDEMGDETDGDETDGDETGDDETVDDDATTDAEDVFASATTTRRLPEPEREPLDDGLVGTVHYPDGDDPAPAVVLLHGSGGIEATQTARLLAGHGYVAASITYFGDPEPLPDTLTEVPVEYVQRTIDRVGADDRVADAPVGLYGGSKGGELALLAGARLDDVGAVVSVAGSGVVWEGLGEGNGPAGASSWTYDGDPVPYVRISRTRADSVRGYYEQGFEDADADAIADATIDVERIDGPVTLVSGREDGLWNAVRFQRLAADRRRDADEPVTHALYDDAGHAIRPPITPTYGRSSTYTYDLGGTVAGNARAGRAYWERTLATFEQGLEN